MMLTRRFELLLADCRGQRMAAYEWWLKCVGWGDVENVSLSSTLQQFLLPTTTINNLRQDIEITSSDIIDDRSFNLKCQFGASRTRKASP